MPYDEFYFKINNLITFMYLKIEMKIMEHSQAF